ncbi:hypothetical protein [Syntrophobacter fumaroxidans]|uniref:C-type lysozyme inhibitor domain-containing protein n=1 Tax=Syntrophobacter fumaroxidans (strain DSM 10017 / MPOB) TaxID=335543 RepID=A0LJE1_SYNFM|nr:hypothetical protein [Syntrophobacter fumaroxidans]ABK17543.1 hypothetical protein Sfum_1858 [Syntrophobacter fumaroxidans MPOB]
MSSSRFHSPAFRGLVFSTVCVVVMVFGLLTALPAPAAAEQAQPPAESDSQVEAVDGISQYNSCFAAGYAVYNGPMGRRIHLRCGAAAPGTSIVYFAVAIGQGTLANPVADYFLTAFDTAVANGKTVWLWYETDPGSGPKIGCGASDCRILRGIEVRN